MNEDRHHDEMPAGGAAPSGAGPAPGHGTGPRPGEKRYWLDDMGNVHKIYWGLWAVCILLVAADLLYDKHAEFPIEGWFGFFGFYGFLSCVSLVLAAKVLRRLVKRPEGYYD